MDALTYDQLYYRTVRKLRPRASRRLDVQSRCEFCTVFLISRFGGKFRRKYCDDCAKNPDLKRILNNIYQKRAYRKRVGKKIPAIRYFELTKTFS